VCAVLVTENDFVLFESQDAALERRRQKRELRVKQRIAALSQDELEELSILPQQDQLCAKLLEWRIYVGVDHLGRWTSADVTAALVARLEEVRAARSFAKEGATRGLRHVNE
jgi:hypothetical protein